MGTLGIFGLRHIRLSVAVLLVAAAGGGAALAAPPPAAADGLPTDSPCWAWQLPIPQGDDLGDVSFVDAQNGWEVGDNGHVLHTTDGGLTWAWQKSGTEANLWSVTFTSLQSGWAGGYGTLLHTTDGGATWSEQASGRSVTDIRFTAPDVGWATAGGDFDWGLEPTALLHTTDGGATWGDVALPGLRPDLDYLHSIAFADADHGVIAGGYQKRFSDGGTQQVGPLSYATTDGGATWTRTQLAESFGWDFDSLASSSVSTYWASTWDNILLRSTDGGVTWAKSTLGGEYDWLGALDFADAQHGWIWSWSWRSSSNSVWRTTDEGATWTSAAAPDMHCWAMDFVSPTHGWVTGYAGWTARTTDGGVTWQMLSTVAPPPKYSSYFNDVAFADDETGLVAGDEGQIMRTTDGGTTWTLRPSGSLATLDSVAFPAAASAWVVGGARVLLHSTDAGVTWRTVVPTRTMPRRQRGLCDGIRLTALSAPDATHVVIAGRNREKDAVVLRSADGGATWRCRRLAPGRWPDAASFLDAQNGWLAVIHDSVRHDPGEVWRTGDGGATWTRLCVVPDQFSVLQFLDASNGWAAGWDRGVQQTTDGGVTWAPVASLPGWYVYVDDLWFANASEGWGLYSVEDVGSFLVHTRDGGVHWSRQSLGTTRYLNAIAFTAASEGWAVGEDGTILHTTNGGGTAPITSHDLVAGADGYYAYDHAVPVHLSAWDAGSGVAQTEYGVYRWDPVTWEDVIVTPATIGTTIDFPAPADHSGDGDFTLWFESTDTIGTRETTRGAEIVIDTLGPRCYARRAAVCTKGDEAVLRFAVADATSERCHIRVDVRARSGRVVKTLQFFRYTGVHWATFRCDLRRGVYRFVVTATDLAGNPQTRAASNLLTVR